MNHLELFKKIQNCAAYLIKKSELEKGEESLKMENNELNNKNCLIEQLIKKTDEVSGWLNPEAACFSSHLLSYQKIINLTGNIVEIGIYCGKYLAILYQYVNAENERVLGIDAFIGATTAADIEYAKSNVFKNVFKVCGDNQRLDILACNSLDLTPKALLEIVHGTNVRFISIDGGHTADVVFHDLHLSTAILKKGGVIAMDDMFNHSLPGVTEGLFRFFYEKNSKALAPFAQCYNKLFLTTPDYYTHYFKRSLEILEEMKNYPTYERTKTTMEENCSLNFAPQLFGYEVICFM